LQDTADYRSVGAAIDPKQSAVDFEPVVKLFSPDGDATWLLTELDPIGEHLAPLPDGHTRIRLALHGFDVPREDSS
jgi:hypothetical protein